jgi:hypothetical protein
MADERLRQRCRLQDRVQVDPTLYPHVREHVDEIFCRQVPVRPRGEGGPPQPTHARIELVEAKLQRGQDVGHRRPPGVVEVEVEASPRKPFLHQSGDVPHSGRGGHPGGVPQRDAGHPRFSQRDGDLGHALPGYVALERIPEGGGDRALDRQAGGFRDPDDLPHVLNRFLDGLANVLPVVAVGCRQEGLH